MAKWLCTSFYISHKKDRTKTYKDFQVLNREVSIKIRKRKVRRNKKVNSRSVYPHKLPHQCALESKDNTVEEVAQMHPQEKVNPSKCSKMRNGGTRMQKEVVVLERLTQEEVVYFDTLLQVLNGVPSNYNKIRTVLNSAYQEVLEYDKDIESFVALSRIYRMFFQTPSIYNSLKKLPFKVLMVRQYFMKEFITLEKNGIELFTEEEVTSIYNISLMELVTRVSEERLAILNRMEGKYLPSTFNYVAYFSIKKADSENFLNNEAKRLQSTIYAKAYGGFHGLETCVVSDKGFHTPEFVESSLNFVGVTSETVKGLHMIPSLKEAVVRFLNNEAANSETCGEEQSTESAVLQDVGDRDKESEVEHANECPEEVVTQKTALDASGTQEVTVNRLSLVPDIPKVTSLNSEASSLVDSTEENKTNGINTDYGAVVYVDCDNVSDKYLAMLHFVDKLSVDKKVLVRLFVDGALTDMWHSLESFGSVVFDAQQCSRIIGQKSMADVLLTEAFVKDHYTLNKNGQPFEKYIVSSDSDFAALSKYEGVNFVYSKCTASPVYVDYLVRKECTGFDLDVITDKDFLTVGVLSSIIGRELEKILPDIPMTLWQGETLMRHIEQKGGETGQNRGFAVKSVFYQFEGSRQKLYNIVTELVKQASIEHTPEGIAVVIKVEK